MGGKIGSLVLLKDRLCMWEQNQCANSALAEKQKKMGQGNGFV
jgi:hypothetical protein